ncbi:MAG: hypothetical protein E7612_06585 [Ruminococcaceae bacterium]|nr:hypothetical protein [Oscillospiraceae bacterium]
MQKFKKNWLKVVSLVLVVGLGMAVIGGLAGFAVRDTTSISSNEFSRGALDSNGIHVETKQSIYTKDDFSCMGLKIEQDFESHATYDVYYYDVNGRFLKAEKGLSGNYTADDDFLLAKSARVVIHPEIPEDEDAEDYTIGFFEVYGIAKELKITVDKEQKYPYESANLYDEKKLQTVDGNSYTSKIALFDSKNKSVYEKYDVYVPASVEESFVLKFIDSNSTEWIPELSDNFYTSQTVGDWVKISFAISDLDQTAEYVSFQLGVPSTTSGCYIFGYND